MGEDSSSRGHWFKSRILDRHLFTLICGKICTVCMIRTKINEKSPVMAHLKNIYVTLLVKPFWYIQDFDHKVLSHFDLAIGIKASTISIHVFTIEYHGHLVAKYVLCNM